MPFGQSELIPDPMDNRGLITTIRSWIWDQCCTLRDFNRYSLGRDPRRDGPVRLQTGRPAYAGQQLIPDPLFEVLEFGIMDLGSGMINSLT